MTEPVYIRQLHPDDAEAFSALRLLGLEQYPTAYATSADAWREVTQERARAAVAASQPARGSLLVGAFQGATLIGLVGCKRESRPAVAHKGTLWGLIVHPEHQRQGVGTRLLAHVLEAAAGMDGLDYVRAIVSATSAAALALLASHDFVQYGEEAGGLHVGAEQVDQVYLRRDLNA